MLQWRAGRTDWEDGNDDKVETNPLHLNHHIETFKANRTVSLSKCRIACITTARKQHLCIDVLLSDRTHLLPTRYSQRAPHSCSGGSEARGHWGANMLSLLLGWGHRGGKENKENGALSNAQQNQPMTATQV